MRITRYLSSLRIRITLAITCLALVSAVIYSIFSWFIYDITDDRLFNWQALAINRQAVEEQRLPQAQFNSFSLIGDEYKLTRFLIKRFPVISDNSLRPKLNDIFEMSNISYYPQGHQIIDVEYQEGIIELQIIASPWGEESLYVVYDITGFETAPSSINLLSDNFALLVLIPLAVLVAILAMLLSIGLTRTTLKPLTELASQITSSKPQQTVKLLTEDYYPDEVGNLANTFNQFIARIENHMENEKRFSREVSHELRTPTTSLTIALELLETTALDTKQQQLLARMKRANQDMTQLIDTFIWLAKNAPENAPVEQLNLFTSVDRALEKLLYLNDKKKLKISNRVDKQEAITANPALLDIVLNNLLRNALQYTQQGSIEITSDGNSLTIVDTGLGIPAEEIKNIERAFYCLQPDGIGLGMSIVQRVVARLGWKLQIKSQEQKGTAVTIVFPT